MGKSKISTNRLRERMAAIGQPAEKGGQTWLAKQTGMSQQGVQSILAGASGRPRLLREIANALETTEAYLLGESNDPAPDRQIGDVKSQPLTPLAEAIHNARKRRGASIRDLARATGNSIDVVVAWEDGASSPERNQLEEIATFLRVDARALERGSVTATGGEELGDATFVSDELPRYVGPRDVEKLGVVAAGDDGDFEFNGKVAEYVPRPKGLADRPGVFSLEIISDSMYPAYRKFDPIFCDRLEPQIGDDVVIETFPEEGASAGKAFVKRLKKRTNSTIVVEQFNPPKEITFDPYAIKHLWRVVPHRELHGL